MTISPLILKVSQVFYTAIHVDDKVESVRAIFVEGSRALAVIDAVARFTRLF